MGIFIAAKTSVGVRSFRASVFEFCSSRQSILRFPHFAILNLFVALTRVECRLSGAISLLREDKAGEVRVIEITFLTIILESALIIVHYNT